MNRDITVLVNSCDDYRDIWPRFFGLLKKYWRNIRDYKIMLNCESKTFRARGGVNVITPKLKKKDLKSWSARLLACLKQIDTDYVLMLIDDFLLNRPVDEETILSCVDRFRRDKDIRCFYMSVSARDFSLPSLYPGFALKNNRQNYIFNFQAGLWDRKWLISILRKGEDPWRREVFTSIRCSYRPGKYYVAVRTKDEDNIPYSYDWFGRLHSGKWVRQAASLVTQAGIEIDFEKRGFLQKDVDREGYLYNSRPSPIDYRGLFERYVINKDKLNIFGKIHNIFRTIRLGRWFLFHSI